jgi:ribosomal protein S18 acetylase RimI-like enzyme
VAAPVTLQPLGAGQGGAARALARTELAGTPYGEGPLETLERVLGTGGDDEARSLVAVRGGELVGLVVYGLVAGAQGAGRLHLVLVTASARLAGVGLSLCDAAAEALRRDGARLVVAEVPDDAATAAGRELLRRAGFREEGRIPDFHRDGVALLLLRRDLA